MVCLGSSGLISRLMRYNVRSIESFTTQGQIWVSNRRVCGYSPMILGGFRPYLKELLAQYDSTRQLVLDSGGFRPLKELSTQY